MKCGGCSAAVKRILSARPGVDSAAVNLLTECAVVRYSGPADRDAFIAETTEALTAKVPFLSGQLLSGQRCQRHEGRVHARSLQA